MPALGNIRTHGAFLVSSEQKEGEIDFVRIVSEKGRTCQLKNPWPSQQVSLTRNQNEFETIEGDLLHIETSVGEVIKLRPI